MAWQDLFVRTDVSETSPDDRKGGLGSPDVIPVGIVPSTNPIDFTKSTSYGTYYNLPIQAGQPNYIYVRAKNASKSGDNSGQAFLVMSDPAVVLWPGGDKWTRIKTNNGNYYSQLKTSISGGDAIGPEAIGVTIDPFTLVPDSSGHRCLVTWLSTKQHKQPDPPPRITDAGTLAQYLRDHPNYAHHNIDIAPNTTGAVTKQQPFSSGTIQEQWTFGIQVENCKGFTVSFSSGTPLPDGTFVKFAPTTVQQNERLTLTVDNIDIPAGWETTFNYTYQQNGLLPPSFSVTFIAYHQPLLGSPLYELADTADELHIAPGYVADDFRGIEVGSIGVMCRSVGVQQ
jgi:hypothetical protein